MHPDRHCYGRQLPAYHGSQLAYQNSKVQKLEQTRFRSLFNFPKMIILGFTMSRTSYGIYNLRKTKI